MSCARTSPVISGISIRTVSISRPVRRTAREGKIIKRRARGCGVASSIDFYVLYERDGETMEKRDWRTMQVGIRCVSTSVHYVISLACYYVIIFHGAAGKVPIE